MFTRIILLHSKFIGTILHFIVICLILYFIYGKFMRINFGVMTNRHTENFLIIHHFIYMNKFDLINPAIISIINWVLNCSKNQNYHVYYL
jgi:hypothetical protein